MKLRLGAVLDQSRAEGPGLRSVLWVQGCSIRCAGCFNPHFFEEEGGEEWAVRDLADRFLEAGTEGITLLGGEPFDQAAPLADLAEIMRGAGRNVLVFSGYPADQLLRSEDPGLRDLLAWTDLLVAGPFLNGRQNFNRNMVGSSNQSIHPLSEAGDFLIRRMQADRNRVEIRIGPEGQLFVNGQGKSLKEVMGQRQ